MKHLTKNLADTVVMIMLALIVIAGIKTLSEMPSQDELKVMIVSIQSNKPVVSPIGNVTVKRDVAQVANN